MKNLSFIALVVLAIVASPLYAAPFDQCPDFVKYGAPSTKGDLLCRKSYALAHNPNHKTPDWVAEHLTKAHAQKSVDRTDDFRPDPDLQPGRRSELKDYEGSGYDRGHMAPAADQWNKTTMSESFLLSNMVPQVGPGNNRGIWKKLEEQVRKWAISRGSVYIFTGPIYAKDEEPETIGTNHVSVPTYLYKIVYDPKTNDLIAFIIPNQKINPPDLEAYLVSVDMVEKQTKLNFLNKLPTGTQRRIERRRSKVLWQ